MTKGPSRAEITAGERTRAAVQRRTLTVVVVSQIFGGAGLAAGITVGALLAEEMSGSESVSGLPSALFTLGSALTAFLIGRGTQKWGRRWGLATGFLVGGLGAVGVVAAAVLASPALLFFSLFIYGAGSATNMQARYSGADLALPDKRGGAVSLAMVSTTLGAVAGPNLVEPMGGLALSLGLPALTGPFLLAGASYFVAGAVLALFLRPDPYLLARDLTRSGVLVSIDANDPAPAEPASFAGSGVLVGASVMILAQVTMVAIMTMTPVHMRREGFTLGAVGVVIGLHIGAMYLPSPVTGWLVDAAGRLPMAVASGLTLGAAGLLAASPLGRSLPWLIAALILLGIGWNFGLITGTALVVDSTTAETRPRVQGNIDVLLSLSGAGAGGLAGLVLAASSYAVLAAVGAALALALVPLLVWFWISGRCPAAAGALD